MIGTQEDELEIFASGQRYRIEQVKSVEKTPDTELSDIVSIGNKLSNYGTYLCNKTHSSPARHIAQPYTIRHSISLTPVDTSSCLVSGKSRGNRKNRGRVRFSDPLDSSDSSKETGGLYAL